MTESTRLLAIDVGAGTQDILLFQEGVAPENNVKMVMPSQTVIVGRRIRQATAAGQDVFLTGSLMGGGASSDAIRAHLKAGRRVFATPQAAKTVRDNLDEVRALGVEIVDQAPDSDALTIRTSDVDVKAIGQALASFDVSLPGRYAVAVQDHGECLECSQRRFRFRIWEEILSRGGGLTDLAYREPPAYMTRMCAVQGDVPGALLMDTAGAAIWGALQDEHVSAHQEAGLIVLNIGNEHTLGALVQGERIWGLFEHHTGQLTTERLGFHVERLRQGMLTNDEVYAAGGHGSYIHRDYDSHHGFRFVALTGPNWDLAQGLGYHRAAPYGDMMIAGCFGLVAAAQRIGM